RVSVLLPLVSVLRLARFTLVTTLEVFALCLIEQIISSRKPLPVRVFETLMTYFVVPPPVDDVPQAVASSPAARNNPMALGHPGLDIAYFLLLTLNRHALLCGNRLPRRGRS